MPGRRTPLNADPLDGAMNIDAVDAETRFDNTAFSNEIVDGRALPLTTTYTCPRCAERVGFNKSDFERRAQRQVSNLSPSIQRSFNDWASQHSQAGNPFLDWACPGCALAVRVYARPWAGGRHGDSGINLAVVLEVADPA